MTQQNTISPFISRIEDVYQLNTDLSNAGYQSVFDVIRVPRKQFIKKHKREFGKYSEAVYDLANGFATQIRRKFRKSELSTAVPFNGASNARLQGLQKNGPTWLGLFDDNWASYCLSSSPEANDSPVSYLSWLYKQALDYETDMDTAPIIKLATRRPDLATLWLDDDAINQVIPSLQLVNEILEDVIQTDIASDSTVDETLAITRYPNLLPYHYPHEQTTLALDNCDESLLGVISQVDTAWPYFIHPLLALGNSENALEVGSNLAPEQQIILTEVDNAKSSDLTDFYKDNFGITATDYNALAELAVFVPATGLPVPQVEQLLSANAGGSLAIQSQNYLPPATPSEIPITVDPSVYGAVFVNEASIPSIGIDTTTPKTLTHLSDSRLDRINRITRLQRWLELPYDQVDKLLTYPIAKDYTPDSCPTANPFVLKNNPTVSTDSMFGRAITFNSTAAQWAYINNDISKSTTPEWSVSMWINIQSTDSPENMLTLVSYGGSQLYLQYNKLNLIAGNVSLGLGGLSNDTWYHLVFTFHQENSFYYCYAGCADRNGGRISSEYTIVEPNQVGNTLSFNCSYGGSEPPVGYSISYDDITLWNYGLNEGEGNALLANTQPACGKSDMLHYYPMDTIYNEVDSIPLKTLGIFQYFQQKYNIDAYEFSALINEITPYAIAPNVPFLDQVFNSPSLFETPFTIINSDFTYTDVTEVNTRIVKQICAGLQISEAQFLLLAKLIDTDKTGKLTCSLDIVSRFYRLVMLPRWLGLSFTDGLSLLSIIGDGSALKTLAAAPIISILDDSGLPAQDDILSILMAASNAADWLRQHGLSASKTYALLQDGSKVSIATNAEVNFINDINQQIPASLLTEAMFENCGVPNFAKDGTPIIWTDTLKSLVDSYGLVIDTAVTLADITKAVTTAITGIIFADLWTQPEIADILANLIYQTQVSQSGIATSALAKALGVDHSLPAFLLPWAGSSTYDLLSQSWALSPTILGTAITTETIPANYLQLLYQVARRSAIVKEFALTPAMLSLYLANPTWFGVPDTSISLPMFYAFSRYCDWLKLTPKEDAVLAYLSWVNSATATTKATVASAATALAALLDWDASEVTLATAHANPTTQIAVTLAHVDTVMRLQTLSTKTGVSTASLIDAGALTPATEPASTASTYADWQSVGESFIAAQAG
ncbi:Tc toxin subunit A [Edaphovirga cremea]|uniref:Tc toxin subunit A n=1 Tax=Edaphovirga cremea TaxID=2267246 RepID=UPI003989BADE